MTIVVPSLVVSVLEGLLRGGPGVLFNLCFLAACVFAAVHVRHGDLPAAPIGAPIAFAVSLLCAGFGEGSPTRQLVALGTHLAEMALWLFAGTLLAGLVVSLRWFLTRRQRRKRAAAD